MGDFDLVKVVLDRIGDMQWMQIAIKPAKPFAFGVLRGASAPCRVFGLPGNPVSSLVSFELLARPALRKMMGHAELRKSHQTMVSLAWAAVKPSAVVANAAKKSLRITLNSSLVSRRRSPWVCIGAGWRRISNASDYTGQKSNNQSARYRPIIVVVI